MPRAAKPLDDDLTDRQKLIRSTADVAKVNTDDRGWIFLHPMPNPSENYPVAMSINDWGGTLNRGVWLAVPRELKAQMDNNRETRYRDVKGANGQTFKQPYDVQPYPFDWEDEYVPSKMAGNSMDLRKSPASTQSS